MAAKETPKQFSARRVKAAVERAKASVTQIQEELENFRGNPADYKQITDSILRKLDVAWHMAAEREARERDRRRSEAQK